MTNSYHQRRTIAAKIDKRPQDVPEVLMKLLAASTRKNIKNNLQVKPDELGVSARELEEWLVAFARGAQYVHEKYGTIFRNVYVGPALVIEHSKEKTDNMIIYLGGRDTVAITLGFVAREINLTRGGGAEFGRNDTDGYYTGLETATLFGVEEAYHAYQSKKLGHKYKDEDKTALKNGFAALQNDKDFHKNNPLERDASKVVRQAIKDLGFSGQYAERSSHLSK